MKKAESPKTFRLFIASKILRRYKKQNPIYRRTILSQHDIQDFMVGTTELESVTSCMSSKRSNQLSYAPVTT